jgi:hypothetical protein
MEYWEHAKGWCVKHQWWHDDMRVCIDDPECCALICGRNPE